MLTSPGVDFAALRRREFSRLDATGSAYLDYTGTALYPESLVKRDGRRLLRARVRQPALGKRALAGKHRRRWRKHGA